MSLTNVSRKTVNVSDLVSDDNVNIREAATYDLRSIVPSLVRHGRLMKPIVAMPHPTREGKYLILQGNRRFRGIVWLTNDPDGASKECSTVDSEGKPVPCVVTPSIVQGFKKVDVIVYNDLTDAEREEVIYDHDAKGLTRAETALAIWRLMPTRSEGEIAVLMYRQIAVATGSAAKLNTLSDKPDERAKEVKAWLHATLANYYLLAGKMRQDVRDDFIVAQRKADQKDAPDSRYVWSRLNCSELAKAYRADVKAGTWDAMNNVGPLTDEALRNMLASADNDDKGDKGGKAPNKKELAERASALQSRAAKAMALVASGNGNASQLATFDTVSRRWEYIADLLAANVSQLPDALRSAVTVWLADGPLASVEDGIRLLLPEGATLLRERTIVNPTPNPADPAEPAH